MKITGGDQLARAFRDLSEAAREDALEEATLPMAQEVADLARSKAPQRTGRMARSIAPVIAEQDSQHIDILVGPEDRYFYARFSEFGVAPHETREQHVRPEGPLSRPLKRARRVTGVHPGQAAQPFLRPALDELAPRVVEEIGRSISESLEAAAVP